MTKISKKHKTELLPQAIDQYLKKTGISQVDLARLAGIDKAYITHLSKGRELIGKSTIDDKYYEAVASVIGYKFEKIHWKHFNTGNFQHTVHWMNHAIEKRERLGIDGNTGLGKTYMITQFKRRYPKSCITFKCSGIQNAKEFAVSFAKAARVSPVGTKGQIIKDTCDAIRSMKNKPFVVIDEFENCKLAKIVPAIKVIADELEGVAAVIIVGIGIQDMLHNAAERERNGYIQLNRRFAFSWIYLHPEISKDIEDICYELGIYNKSAVKWLTSRVKDFDSLRRICITALEAADRNNTEVTGALLTQLFTF